jgi:hypothetical protein
MMLSHIKKDDEFRKYIDMMFIKTCEDLQKSINSNKTTVKLPSGRTVDLTSTSYSCEE